ncbi:hypothetical protein [Streptomyces sp. NBC_01216]|uniref:hypothetical protein n=1 Tax=unclassified Streptomyces TaxID=2593676 RepID=UPI002E129E26|nr:hypothetical protein OG393_19095 [Streptomyces sp. NBC_01216]
MSEFLDVALGFPAMLFTAALIIALGFWLLVLCGAAGRDSFDSDVDAEAWHLAGVPVAVSVSVFLVTGWSLSLLGSVALDRAGLPGAVDLLLSLLLLLLAPFVSWRVTRRIVRPLAKLFPDEPGLPARPSPEPRGTAAHR